MISSDVPVRSVRLHRTLNEKKPTYNRRLIKNLTNPDIDSGTCFKKRQTHLKRNTIKPQQQAYTESAHREKNHHWNFPTSNHFLEFEKCPFDYPIDTWRWFRNAREKLGFRGAGACSSALRKYARSSVLLLLLLLCRSIDVVVSAADSIEFFHSQGRKYYYEWHEPEGLRAGASKKGLDFKFF